MDKEKILHLGKCSLGEIVLNNDAIREVNPFDKAVTHLLSKGYRLASGKEVATARMELQTPEIYHGGNIMEGFVDVPYENEIILTRESPQAFFAKQVCEEKGPFYLTERGLARFLKDSVKCHYGELPITENQELLTERNPFKGLPSIPVEEFRKHPITLFLFGSKAQEYGDFMLDKFGLRYCPLNVLMKSSNAKQKEGFRVGSISLWHAEKGGIDFGCGNSIKYDSSNFGIK